MILHKITVVGITRVTIWSKWCMPVWRAIGNRRWRQHKGYLRDSARHGSNILYEGLVSANNSKELK